MDQQEPTDLLLTPAACYPLYPVVAARGRLPEEGGLYDCTPSASATSRRAIRRACRCSACANSCAWASDEQVLAFRETWIERAQDFINDLALPFDIDVANDPFFGRTGRLLADSQREQKLKFELLVPINSESNRRRASASTIT